MNRAAPHRFPNLADGGGDFGSDAGAADRDQFQPLIQSVVKKTHLQDGGVFTIGDTFYALSTVSKIATLPSSCTIKVIVEATVTGIFNC